MFASFHSGIVAHIFTTLLVWFLILQDQHLSAQQRNQVNGNIISSSSHQQHNQNLTSSTLPALSERANGVNSRYLSAASTASLAAATVAAASGSSQQSNTQDANRNFLIHQQQQQQLQQQQQNAVNNLQQQQQLNNQAQTANAQVSQAQQAQQQVTNAPVINQAPQFNSAQPQQVLGSALGGNNNGAGLTPVMSTTYTFNPLTGQFSPSDLSTALISASPNSNYNQFQAQAQQPPINNNFQANSYALPSQANFGNAILQQQQQRFNQFANSLQTPQQNQFTGFSQFPFLSHPHRQNGGQFNRRAGYGLPSQGSRVNNVYNNLPLVNEDEISSFLQQQQQQQQQQQFLNAESNNNINAGYGSDQFLLPSNSYQFVSSSPGNSQVGSSAQQQPFANVEHPINQPSTGLPSSSSSLVLPTSFSTAFSGPPPSLAEYKNDQCVAADNRHGTCYQASECIKRGGTPMGKCGNSILPQNLGELSGSSYVCCLFDITCGQFAAERFVYFRNPGYPNTFDQSRMCRTKIGKLDKGVCQFRLDLLRFDVAKPTNGNCSQDMLVVSGQNENYVIPKICGLNDGQHYYVGVDESGVITLHMMMMGAFYRRSFEILVTQIPCRSDYAAPAHCLQYFMGTHGTIKSFNYDDQEPLYGQQSSQSGVTYDLLQQTDNGGPTAPYGLQFSQQQRQQQALLAALQAGPGRFANVYGGQENQFGGYPNDLDYTMCIRKESGFCSITYQLSRSESGAQQPFAVGHSLFGGANDTSGWHPVSTECRDDYLLIGGVRLCSGGLTSNQFTGPHVTSPLYDPNLQHLNQQPSSIQFSQNGTILNSAGFNGGSSQMLQQQLQNQYNLIMQQLARIQQQQQQQQVSGNGSYSTNGNNNSAATGQQVGNLSSNNGNNLEQQQAALVQQSMLIQQQLNNLITTSNNAGSNNNNGFANNRYSTGQYSEGAIITDTTPGPFILRFVSNIARNARGFHIDYRQNPCK